MRFLISIALSLVCLGAATLQQLSLDEMSQKSTLIVRGRVTRCGGEARGTAVYTRCKVTVSELWKGQAGTETEFVVPGGSASGLIQTFVGTPTFNGGDEYVLFLWAGRSGTNQIIGLTQGKFEIAKTAGSKGEPQVRRAASDERMLDKSGNEIADQPLEMLVSELRRRVKQALAGSTQ